MKAFLTSLFSASKKSASADRVATSVQTNANLQKQADAAIRSDDFSAAAGLYQQLVQANSTDPDVYVSYGYALLNLNEFAKAKTILLKAVELDAKNADSHYMLGTACSALGDASGAERAWRASHEISPHIESLYCDFCLLLFKQDKLVQAKALMQTGIQHYPNNADMHFYLGNLHTESADFAAAVDAYERSRQLNPNSPYMLSSYSTALRQTGDLALSSELTKQALALAPGEPSIFSNYLMGIQYSGAISKEEKFAAHVNFAKQFESPLISQWGNYSNSLQNDRKIRIGYVSGDFRNHSLIFFIAPILATHDKSRFEVFCYYSHPSTDADTQRIKALADYFVNCYDMTDDALADKIRSDQIDVLIDLSGHTGHNRLLVFARKPAPVQMTWLGYQATTGLRAMDYRITEESLDPTGTTETFHSEKLLRLPSSGTFSPLPSSPDVNQLPSLNGEPFTFACLNNPSKIADEAIVLWARILVKAPASQLLIGNSTAALAQRLTLSFAKHGVTKERLVFHPKVSLQDYLQLHHRIDLALDTFPYNGGTTTFHSLWMGVPIIALQGDLAISKVGASIMSGMGLGKFCGMTVDEYVERAVHYSNNLPELSAVRSTLRPILGNLLGNLTRIITSALERSFEDCWRDYCTAAQLVGSADHSLSTTQSCSAELT